MAAPDNDADNLKGVYSGYDDPTGTGSPVGRPEGGDAVGMRHIPLADYENLGMDTQGGVVYVTTGESGA